LLSSAGVAAPDPLPPFDLKRFRTKPLKDRGHKVETGLFAKPVSLDATAGEFVASLPGFLGAESLRALAAAIATATAAGRPVVWGMGGHVVKVGLAPLLLDLLRRGHVQGFAMNGAAAIHDAEIALRGSTSEDVGKGLFEGEYGASEETGLLFAAAAADSVRRGVGLGTALGDALLAKSPPHAELSLLCAARTAGVPVTVHVAVGTDTVHMHPACDGATLGAATHGDFRRLATLVEGMDGGVYVNVGSAVLLPEVFLKAVAIVHNADPSRRIRITTGNLDFLRHYRPRVNVVERPAEKGYEITGPHELVVPLLRLAVLAAVAGGSPAAERPAKPAAKRGGAHS
jgi:hypothetical protein